MAGLILFGCIGVLLMQVFRPQRELRAALLLLLSLGFLYYCASSAIAFCLMVAWVLTVYLLAQLAIKAPGRLNLMAVYILPVVLIFIAFKLGLFAVLEKGSLMEYAMPIGFSFVMFHSIALVLDRQRIAPGTPLKWYEFTSSALFFPTLAIGPFHKFQVFQEGLKSQWNGQRLFHGYCLVCLGAFKLGISGVLLKPYFLRGMPIVFNPERNPFHPSVILLLGSVFLFANFSGYSDLVVGFAKMMGFDIPPNFRFPFLARSMAGYWRNWHVSLGAWFREYVFLPLHYKLASQRSLKWSNSNTAAIAIFITFFLIGIWHEFSVKILLYSIANGALVAYLFPNNRNAWIGIPLTFALALLINGIFLSRDLETFERLMSYMLEWPSSEKVHINLVTAGLCFFLLAIFYAAEKLVSMLEHENLRWSTLIVSANFVLCIVELFVGITLGIGRTDTVYIGY